MNEKSISAIGLILITSALLFTVNWTHTETTEKINQPIEINLSEESANELFSNDLKAKAFDQYRII